MLGLNYVLSIMLAALALKEMWNDSICMPFCNDAHGSVAALFLKRASDSGGIRSPILNVNLYIGDFLYLPSAVLNIWLLRIMDYSVVLPLTSLTYVWTMILSYIFLKEKITSRKIVGVTCILVGAVFVTMQFRFI